MICGYLFQSSVLLSMILCIDWDLLTHEALVRSEKKRKDSQVLERLHINQSEDLSKNHSSDKD